MVVQYPDSFCLIFFCVKHMTSKDVFGIIPAQERIALRGGGMYMGDLWARCDGIANR